MFPWNFFPMNENMKKMMSGMKTGDFQKYTQELIEKMIPAQMNDMMKQMERFQGTEQRQGQQTDSQKQNHYQNHPPSKLNYSVFETHEHIFVRIKVKKEDWLKSIKLYHTSNLVIIEHVPKADDKHSIPLPAIVRRRGGNALFKDGILEIKLPKRIDTQYSEISIFETN